LRPVCKITGYAAAIAVVLTAVGACWADETTTKPAPVGFSALSDNGSGDITGLMWQMLAAALVVLAVGTLALFVVKRLLPRIRQASHKQISVLETAYLGSRKAVHLLQVGSRKLLVASSPEGVVRLDDVTSAFSSEYSDIAMRVGAETDAADRAGDGTGGLREADSNA
jgi:flagellar biogenesis protein FliO